MDEGFQKVNKGNKIIITKIFGEAEIEKIKKYPNCTEIAFWNIKYDNLDCLTHLPKLKSIELYGTTINDYTALVKIKSLKELFINRIANHADLSFINTLKQIEVLSLLYLTKLTKLPSLADCKKLKSITVWNCKNLANIKSLAAIPNLLQVDMVDTPQMPQDLEFLMKIKKMKYISAQFPNTKLNNQFEELLAKYGKKEQED